MSQPDYGSASTNDDLMISAPLFDYLITTSLQMIGRNQLNNFVGRNLTCGVISLFLDEFVVYLSADAQEMMTL